MIIAKNRGDIYLIKTDSLGYTGIEENSPSAKPVAFEISAWPNPFNFAINISFDAPQRIEVFDVNGGLVQPLTEPDFMTPRVEVRGGAHCNPPSAQMDYKQGSGGVNREIGLQSLWLSISAKSFSASEKGVVISQRGIFAFAVSSRMKNSPK